MAMINVLSLVLAAVAFRTPEVIPPVAELTCRTNVEVRLDATQRVTVRCGDARAADWVRMHAKQWFGFEPRISVASPERSLTNGCYRLTADSDGLVIEAGELSGVRNAMFTLRQIVERDSCGYTVQRYRMPEFEILDRPALSFRGLHLCWFPEQSERELERQIRMAAAYKFNYVVLESWGVFCSEQHPWFGWKDGPMTKEAVGRLVRVAEDLGVTLIPQINVFGHASASRSCVGKHAALDCGPEYQPLFEPAGGLNGSMSSAWNWCLSNPEAVRTVRELVVEMHEAFGSPPFFHIGCDEADEPTCASCRSAQYDDLVCTHISGICELLRQRGARALMWHDMLLEKGDARWKGFYANGSETTARLVGRLPKDVVVCDWYYGDAVKSGAYPTLEYFSKTCGFDTLSCSWNDKSGIRAQSAYARDHGLYGTMGTVWHHFGGTRFPALVQATACGAWGRGEYLSDGHFATVWRQCGWDSGAASYKDAGWNATQSSRDILGR